MKYMKTPQIIEFNTSKDCRCPCGGEAMIEGTGSVRIPTGFGFAPGSIKFQVDAIRYSGFMGTCMKCGKRLLFWKTRSKTIRFPRNINNKIKAADGLTKA